MKNKPIYPTYKKKFSGSSFQLEEEGMTLREHYAGLAMQGMAMQWFTFSSNEKDLAERAVVMADALIKELEKE